ncbi:MAG: hypothetical protein AB8F34_13300 [Akkermansiaceae bacterium]
MLQNNSRAAIIAIMTIRFAMLIFVVSFAAITGWLVTRKPADSDLAQTPPVPSSAEKDSKEKKTQPESNTPTTDVVAISDEEQELKKLLQSITIPRIDIQDEPLDQAIAFLNLSIRELEPRRLGSLNFLVRKPTVTDDAAPTAADTRTVTLQAENISIADVIDRICTQTGHDWSIEDGTLVLNPGE